MKLSKMIKNPTKAKWRKKKKAIEWYKAKYEECLLEQPSPNLDLENDSADFMEQFRHWLTRKTILIRKLEELGYVIESNSEGILEQSIGEARSGSSSQEG